MTQVINRFKNSSGVHLLKPIFFEWDDSLHEYSVYTLKDNDHQWNGNTYPSLRRLYVELEDPTEYLFATTYLDGWTHFVKLSRSPWFSVLLEEWRAELSVRLKAKALVQIMAKAKNISDKESFQANKFLLQGSWNEEIKEKVGRPSKEKIKEEASRLFKEQSVYDDDFDRIMKPKEMN